jgi:GDP-L-fucose synthase
MRPELPLWITGHTGLLGRELVSQAAAEGAAVLTAPRAELDLRDAAAVRFFIRQHQPAAVIHAAARNAGFPVHLAQPADLLADNLAMTLNVIQAAAEARVPRLLFVSSACVYAGGGDGLREAAALTEISGGAMSGYALAKQAGMALCEAVSRQHGLAYHSIVPCNLYGPGDHFAPERANVLAGMMQRMATAARENAETFTVWGPGTPRREFLHARDCAAACLLLLRTDSPPARVNCGPGSDLTMLELAEQLRAVTGFRGRIITDPSQPGGVARKLLDSSPLRALGWAPCIGLEEGLRETFAAMSAPGARRISE